MALDDTFNDSSDPGEEWFALEAGSFPAVPRPASDGLVAVRETLPLPILDTEGFRAREEQVKAALLILSQSKTARKLAQAALASGYSIHVDPPVIGGAGEASEEDAQGSTDHANRRINLRGTDDPLRMTLTLAHELAHISQIVNGGLDLAITKSHPVASLRQLLAMEGDARAYEMLVAIELSHKTKDEPDERLLFPQMMELAGKTIGSSFAQKIIARVRPMLQKDEGEEGHIAPQKVMAAIFKGFYGSPSLRAHYEDTILETLGRQDRETLQDPLNFQGGLSAKELETRLDAHAVPYLQAAPQGYIDLDGAQMLSVSQKTQAALLELEKIRHENPATQNDATWRVPAYAIETAGRRKPQAPGSKGNRP